MQFKFNRIVFWGTYDTGKPRVRLLLAGARAMGLEVLECHSDIWKGVEDKSQLYGIKANAKRILSLFLSYPLLVYRYLQLPPHDVLVVGYMGQFDIIVIWLFARLRRVPICWDVFISLYDTVVVDRKIVPKKSMAALLLYILEWLSSRAANQLFMDTLAHAEYFKKLYRLRSNSVQHIYVGAEPNIFKKKGIIQKPKEIFTILFYGQFIPLHGIDTIVRSAKIIEESRENVRWILIGKGQEEPYIDELIKKIGVNSIHRISWVPYEQLIEYINEADICLGVFGASGKATRVIPNKVYQILSVGKPLITADTPAIREIYQESPILRFVESGNPEALAMTILDLWETLEELVDIKAYLKQLPVIGYVEVGKQFLDLLKKCNC
jgi:glycosyltransferase involved in cell wall biosynthesis